MRKFIGLLTQVLLVAMIVVPTASSQVTVTGKISDSADELPLLGANGTVRGVI